MVRTPPGPGGPVLNGAHPSEPAGIPGGVPGAGGATRTGPRSDNQDHHLIRPLPDGVVLAVADGMGGHAHGAVASRMATDALAAADPDTLTDPDGLRGLIAGIDRSLRAEGERRGSTMGCTLTVVVVTGDRALVGHVGDTRAWWLRPGEPPLQVTDDHSVVEGLRRAGAIDDAQASGHPDRNILAQALGAGPVPVVDVLRLEGLGAGDTLLVTSDGLHGVLDPGALSAAERRCADPADLCARLAGEAEAAGARDNITVVAWRQPAGTPGPRVVRSLPPASSSRTTSAPPPAAPPPAPRPHARAAGRSIPVVAGLAAVVAVAALALTAAWVVGSGDGDGTPGPATVNTPCAADLPTTGVRPGFVAYVSETRGDLLASELGIDGSARLALPGGSVDSPGELNQLLADAARLRIDRAPGVVVVRDTDAERSLADRLRSSGDVVATVIVSATPAVVPRPGEVVVSSTGRDGAPALDAAAAADVAAVLTGRRTCP